MFGKPHFDTSPHDGPSLDASEVALRMAGEAGQVCLARTAESASARACVDQHAAEIREALSSTGAEVTPGTLVSYARGFIEAAIGRGWWPPHRLREPDRDDADGVAGDGGGGELDWESLRLAAVCDLLIETELEEWKLSRNLPR
jgi:hypothetical protein